MVNEAENEHYTFCIFYLNQKFYQAKYSYLHKSEQTQTVFFFISTIDHWTSIDERICEGARR